VVWLARLQPEPGRCGEEKTEQEGSKQRQRPLVQARRWQPTVNRGKRTKEGKLRLMEKMPEETTECRRAPLSENPGMRAWKRGRLPGSELADLQPP